jgi:hypothetical protein
MHPRSCDCLYHGTRGRRESAKTSSRAVLGCAASTLVHGSVQMNQAAGFQSNLYDVHASAHDRWIERGPICAISCSSDCGGAAFMQTVSECMCQGFVCLDGQLTPDGPCEPTPHTPASPHTHARTHTLLCSNRRPAKVGFDRVIKPLY